MKYYLDLFPCSLRRLDEHNPFVWDSCKATTFIQSKQEVIFANTFSSVKALFKVLSALWTSRNALCALRNLEASALRKVEIFCDLFELEITFGKNPRTIFIIALLEQTM